TVLQGGEIRAWSTFLDSAQEAATGAKAAGGAGFRILTGTVTSPTLASQLRKLLALFPQAKWHQWEPAVSDGARDGAKLAFARALAAKLGHGNAVSLPADAEKWLNTVVADLQKAHGSSLVVAGEQQSAAVHALAHAINAALGNVGTTVYYTEPVEAEPVNQL